MARTNNLTNFLTDVADAIREKTGSQELIQASDFDTEIASIESGGDISEYFNTEMNNSTTSSRSAFLQVIKKIPPLNIRNISELRNAFSYSSIEEVGKLTTTGISKTSSFQSMFFECTKLKSVDLSGIDFSGAQVLTGMFNGCTSLTSLDLSNLNSSSITAMIGSFYNCKSLMRLDIRNQDFTYVTNVGDTFKGVPANCEIIVKDQANKEWILNQRSDFTNIKTVAELE